MSRPVPLPRTKIYSSQDKSEDDETFKCGSAPQSPTRRLVGSTPPPVAPKKWTVRRSSGGFDYANLEKVEAKPSAPLPQEQPEKKYDIVNQPDTNLLNWWKDVRSWSSLCTDLQLRGEPEVKIIKAVAEHLYKAIQVYILLLTEHGGTLKEHTLELLRIADSLDKVTKGTKIAGIVGTTAAAGGAVAVAGVILAPFTFGATLALTAVGVGVAAAGGVTGASAAIANKVKSTQLRKQIEKTLQEYKDMMETIHACSKFIHEGMEKLQKHDLPLLIEARRDSVRVTKMVHLASTGGASARAIEANSKASGLVDGFALGMEIYFTQDKDGPKLQKGLVSKFAKKIRILSTELNKGLDELMQIKDLYSKNCLGE